MSNPSLQKRQKERLRQDRQKEKEAKRIARKDKPIRPAGSEGEDPDIAGIIPGPQPIPEEDEG
jgi:hypothetical protein